MMLLLHPPLAWLGDSNSWDLQGIGYRMGSIVIGRKVARKKVCALSQVCNVNQGTMNTDRRKYDEVIKIRAY